jgi:hypothetical protein
VQCDCVVTLLYHDFSNWSLVVSLDHFICRVVIKNA